MATFVRRVAAISVVSILPLLLCCCGSLTKNTSLAEDAVTQFHSQLDAEQYAALYAGADPNFHGATSEAQFTKLLQAIHHKLGSVRQANLSRWNTSWYAGTGTTVTLVYDTTFSAGSGTEQFTWHISDNRAMLYGYHINSDDLIEK
jgi:hypothetical protein